MWNAYHLIPIQHQTSDILLFLQVISHVFDVFLLCYNKIHILSLSIYFPLLDLVLRNLNHLHASIDEIIVFSEGNCVELLRTLLI